jgi:hypothetical protein
LFIGQLGIGEADEVDLQRVGPEEGPFFLSLQLGIQELLVVWDCMRNGRCWAK